MRVIVRDEVKVWVRVRIRFIIEVRCGVRVGVAC